LVLVPPELVPVPPLEAPPPPAEGSFGLEGELQATRGGRTSSEMRERKLARRGVDMVTVKGRRERERIID
jgi:hypothetical protein